MNSKIKERTIGKYTCLDFPERKARLLYDNKTKQYEVYRYAEDQSKMVEKEEASESPLWKMATLVTVGICIGMLTILGIVLLR